MVLLVGYCVHKTLRCSPGQKNHVPTAEHDMPIPSNHRFPDAAPFSENAALLPPKKGLPLQTRTWKAPVLKGSHCITANVWVPLNIWVRPWRLQPAEPGQTLLILELYGINLETSPLDPQPKKSTG